MIYYSESHEASRAFIADGMDVKRHVDIPMGAMWMPGFPTRSQEEGDADILEAASVAHLYGKPHVAAESFTTYGDNEEAYALGPAMLKPTADRELVDGVNLFVIHTSVHQPQRRAGPGVTLGPFGQWFTRQDTWAEQAAPWVTYLARSSYLLQQGEFAADILYYYGQDSNITVLFGTRLPPLPEGYRFDFATADALTRLSVEGGRLVTKGGASYRVLTLDPHARTMSLDVLKSMAHLVSQGATLVGPMPTDTPSAADNPDEFRALAEAVWGRGGDTNHRYGEGVVISGITLADALARLNVSPDFTYPKASPDTNVSFVHRRLADGDIYFLVNRNNRVEDFTGVFRVTGRVPELWHADSGAIDRPAFRAESDHTLVDLKMTPQEAVFVVFRHPAGLHSAYAAKSKVVPLGVVKGPWTVEFQRDRGAPARVSPVADLTSWSASADPGIRYFSGSATYRTTLTVKQGWLQDRQRIELDLGKVRDVAEVFVAGRSVGILWHSPYVIDITDLVREGDNELKVRVTNLWPNRLIGDRQPRAPHIAFTTMNPYLASSALRESGLLGPVLLERVIR
jgi:hypothetical protein